MRAMCTRHAGRRSPSAHAACRPVTAAALRDANLTYEQLLTKPQVMAITGLSFPTLWQWMRDGRFPRARSVGGTGKSAKSVWLRSEIDRWLAELPIRPLKGDTLEAAE
jgi:predicted DNA-binding transcriptional regulator AlpA